MRKITIKVSNFPPNQVIEKEYNHFDIDESVITPEGIGIIAGNFEGYSYKNRSVYWVSSEYQINPLNPNGIYWGNPDYERYPVTINGSIRMFYRKELKGII